MGTSPSDLLKGMVILLRKRKGDHYHSITPLSTPSKDFTQILLIRIHAHLLRYSKWGMHLSLELVYISLWSACVDVSFHWYIWVLKMEWSSTGEPERHPSLQRNVWSLCCCYCHGQDGGAWMLISVPDSGAYYLVLGTLQTNERAMSELNERVKCLDMSHWGSTV